MECALALDVSEEELRKFPEDIKYKDKSTQTQEYSFENKIINTRNKTNVPRHVPALLKLHVCPVGHRTSKQTTTRSHHRDSNRDRHRDRDSIRRQFSGRRLFSLSKVIGSQHERGRRPGHRPSEERRRGYRGSEYHQKSDRRAQRRPRRDDQGNRQDVQRGSRRF